MAPFLLYDYPRRSLTRRRLARSPQAMARLHFLLTRALEAGSLRDGEVLHIGGRPAAAVHRGAVEYLGELGPGMRKALQAYGGALRGAERYLERYALEGGGRVFALDGPPLSAEPLAPAGTLKGPDEPPLLLKIYWLRLAEVPERIDRIVALMDEASQRLKGRARRRYRADMREQVGKLRALLKEIEMAEISWLKELDADRFAGDERLLPGHAAMVSRAAELEQAAQRASDISAWLTRAALGG